MKIRMSKYRWWTTESEFEDFDKFNNYMIAEYLDDLSCAFDEHINQGRATTWYFGKELKYSEQAKMINLCGYQDELEYWISYHLEIVWNTLEEGDATDIGELAFSVIPEVR